MKIEKSERAGVGISKPTRIVSWKQPKAARTLKKKKKPKSGDAPTASIRDILDGGATPTYVVEPLAAGDAPGAHGTVLLVPNGEDYYFALVYVGGEEGSVIVSLPEVQGILVMDLPNGMLTSVDEMNQAIEDGTGGPPGVVGPTGQ